MVLKSVTIAAVDFVMKMDFRDANCKSASLSPHPTRNMHSYPLIIFCFTNNNAGRIKIKLFAVKSVCANGSNTFFPGLTNRNLRKFGSDFSTHLSPDSCICVPGCVF